MLQENTTASEVKHIYFAQIKVCSGDMTEE